MKLTTEYKNTVTIVHLAGRFDSSFAHVFKNTITTLISRGNRRYIVNLGDVTYIDSGGLGSLVSSLRQVRKEKGDMKMAELSTNVRSVFELTRLHRIFELFDDSDIAALSFNC
jgi:anti-sigma B factor antagonist